MPNSLDETDLRPPEIQEILSEPPGWLLNSGPLMLFFFSLLIFASAWLIEYPDTVKGTVICSSTNHGQYIATILISAQDISEVKVGQKVFIELKPYPSNDFGELKASLSRIQYDAQSESYKAIAELSSGLTTTIGKPISFLEDMSGIATIYGEKRSILHRLFHHEQLIQE